MFALYGLVAFVTTLAAPLATVWKAQPEIAGSNALAMLGNLMNYLAYLVMGIPAGIVLNKFGYKKTAVIGCLVGGVGILIQRLSGVSSNGFPIYLLGAFTSGVALCLLNVVVNPMLNTLGGGGSGGNRLNMLGGTFNSFCGALTPLLVGVLIGSVTKRTSLADVYPVLYIAMAVFFVAALVLALLPLPERLPASGKALGKSPLAYPHCRWGVLGVFLFMGTSIGIAGTLNLWLVSLGHSAATGGFFFSAYVLLMLVGRLLASSFAQKIPVRSMLAGASASALFLLILGVFLAGITVKVPVLAGSSLELVAVPLTAPLLVCCGLFTSVMWSSIFALSVEGLGEATASASGWFMTMVAGGGLIPLFQNFIADQAGFRVSYIVPALVFVYLLAYSFKLSKVR
ncbi:MAG: MFS transporter [Kiritimatiellae bacterium]|nr:MFS transporter [Kiritimatiellia bacterium]